MTEAYLKEIKKFKEQINEDYRTTELFADDTINDYLAQEIELSECVTYIRFCIKRVNILKDAVRNSGLFDEKYIEDFNKKSDLLLDKINPLKGTKDTVLHSPSILTCNCILKMFKENYEHYTNKNENQFQM